MEELTVEEMQALPEGSVVYDRSNDKLWRIATGWRYSPVYDDGSYLMTSSDAAVRLWGPMTLGFKGPEWEKSTALENTKDLMEVIAEIWEEADRNTQNMMIEMIRDWYLERGRTDLN